MALSLVLLVGAGIVVRAQYLWLSADPNFETRQVLTVRVTPPSGGDRNQDTTQTAPSLLLTLKERVQALSGRAVDVLLHHALQWARGGS